MTNDELLHKWVNRTLTPEELLVFQKRKEYAELTELYRQTEHLAAPKFEEAKVLNNILQQPKSPLKVVKSAKRVSITRYFKYGIAASLFLVVSWLIFNLIGNTPTQVVAEIGAQKNGTLPDQSTYILNAESTLSFDKKNWHSNRILALQGEAFFSVEKGEKFLVKTPTGQVQVLGTQFNVWSREGLLEVACKTGKVAVLTQDGQTIKELLPNEAIRIKTGKIIESWMESKAEIGSWTEGITKLRKVAVTTVVAALQRQYNIEIITNNINTTAIVSCNFQHDNLELALKTALSAMEIQYRIEGNQVFLTK